jgi:hypothetical protein
MIPTELLVAMAALVLAAVWIVRQELKLKHMDSICDDAVDALEKAHKTVDMYQQVLSDVAIGQATLEVTDDGYIIATHSAFGKVQIH